MLMLAAVRVLLLCALSLAGFSSLLLAQPTLRGGSLRGTVYESYALSKRISSSDSLSHSDTLMRPARTAIPIIGARIQLRGTSLGAISDINGFYQISNIPRGTYDIIYSAAEPLSSNLSPSKTIRLPKLT